MRLLKHILWVGLVMTLLSSCCKKLTSSTVTQVRDSVVVTQVIDTVAVSVANDSARFDSLIVELLDLEKKLIKKTEDSIKVAKKKNNVIRGLRAGVYSDTSFVVPTYTEFKGSDSIYTKTDSIFVDFENGKISLDIKSEKATIATETEITKTKVYRKITFWIWIRDERTIALLIFILLMIFLFRLIKK